MAHISGHKRRRTLSRLATAAIAAALIGTTAGTAAADAPALSAQDLQKAAQSVAPVTAGKAPVSESPADAPRFPLMAVNGTTLYRYFPDGHGGFTDRKAVNTDWRGITSTVQVDLNQDGLAESHYLRTIDGSLFYVHGGSKDVPATHQRIGGGWNIYNRITSPGNLGGSGEADLIARDQSGVLWLYLARPDGTLGDRIRVGAGWDQFTDIVGRGDLNGDGKADIVAKDRNGVLWFYKGTGDSNDPFASRVKVGSGWDAYDMLVSSGDVDLDNRSDLLARDKSGVLWLYKGNGNQNDPFANRVRIGGGWGQYDTMF
ncbi:VCBS repeat-containing protein [Streptomyces luteoverticillatus]|uniref:VCBS repeat-containing protein n=1 Tax=Streptomyces luteoverticillatus TaxID=66425 RepID=A0A3Q9FZJ2_STRLT|nr:VCBS repeat-containing protein [Streptomyces luteoverticillatus]AZQ74008.1 VCBS repeat-containing protein [Streptomyces luteoverticillatus]